MNFIEGPEAAAAGAHAVPLSEMGAIFEQGAPRGGLRFLARP